MRGENGEFTINSDELQTRLRERLASYRARLDTLCAKEGRMSQKRVEKVAEDLAFIARRLDLLSVFSFVLGQHFDVAVLEAIVASFKAGKAEERTMLEKRRRAKTLEPLVGNKKLHRRARGSHPKLPSRVTVRDEQVDWSAEWADYDPVRYTAPSVLENDRDRVPEELKPKRGWADPELPVNHGEGRGDENDDEEEEDMSEYPRLEPFGDRFLAELKSRETFEVSSNSMADVMYDDFGCPLNPRGRTGMCGRGLLGKWGPNHAADPIVTRFNPHDPTRKQLQMVAIRRKDTGEW